MGSLSQVAEALYQVRGVLESGVKDSAQRQCLKLAEHALASYLRDAACEPGETSTDADHLKLNLMRAKREGPHLVLEREVDVIESYIGEAMLAEVWLLEDKAGLHFPRFDRWNGETGKRRLQQAKWLRRKRKATGESDRGR